MEAARIKVPISPISPHVVKFTGEWHTLYSGKIVKRANCTQGQESWAKLLSKYIRLLCEYYPWKIGIKANWTANRVGMLYLTNVLYKCKTHPVKPNELIFTGKYLIDIAEHWCCSNKESYTTLILAFTPQRWNVCTDKGVKFDRYDLNWTELSVISLRYAWPSLSYLQVLLLI